MNAANVRYHLQGVVARYSGRRERSSKDFTRWWLKRIVHPFVHTNDISIDDDDDDDDESA